MDANTVNNFPLRPMKTPFAGTALVSANTSSVGGTNVSVLPATGETVANVATGFPETFSTSIANGGKYIKRADVNAMGYLATIMAFRQQVGMPNEWNRQICEAIGGYPKGAMLDYCVRSGSVITETYKITSLVDNNMENPTSTPQANWANWKRIGVNADYVNSQVANATAGGPQKVAADYFVGGTPTSAYASWTGWVGANSTLLINTSGYCTSVFGYWDYSGSHLQFDLKINNNPIINNNAGNRRFSYALKKGDTLHFTSDRSMYFELTLYHANSYFII